MRSGYIDHYLEEAGWVHGHSCTHEHEVQGFYKKDEIETLIRRREIRQPLAQATISTAIAGRYYQQRAIRAICESLEQGRLKALLVQATGTGKTRTAISPIQTILAHQMMDEPGLILTLRLRQGCCAAAPGTAATGTATRLPASSPWPTHGSAPPLSAKARRSPPMSSGSPPRRRR